MEDNIISLRPSRPLLLRYLESHVEQAHLAEEQLAVLMIQVQHGMDLAALFTSHVIESLLEQLAMRLAGICRKRDRVVRIGYVEYSMLLPEILNEGHALLAANRVMLALAQPFVVDGRTVPLEVKIGISLFPEHAAKPETLVRYAESALGEAKSAKLPYAVYSGRGLSRLSEDWDIQGGIDSGLKNGDFEAYFQPKMDLRTRRLSGAEALVRWRHPERGVIPPADFLGVAAASGRLKPLTSAVVNMALDSVSRWPGPRGAMSVSVNIDPTLLDETLVASVKDALAFWGVPPQSLILEITETGVMDQPEFGYKTLALLSDTGVRISIDDFGTGYSSLGNFRHVPATELKIDKSFVTAILDDQFDARIVRSIVALARTFELAVAAEGAESVSILGRLATLDCDYAQGYCISAPLPADAFIEFIAGYEPMMY